MISINSEIKHLLIQQYNLNIPSQEDWRRLPAPVAGAAAVVAGCVKCQENNGNYQSV